eukprot:11172836-Lingulodinium_polyedra.AAC.1
MATAIARSFGIVSRSMSPEHERASSGTAAGVRSRCGFGHSPPPHGHPLRRHQHAQSARPSRS